MKKITALFTVILIICISMMLPVNAETKTVKKEKNVIKEAISKYKDKNYVGCISDLKMYVEDEPKSSIAWYYLGSSYMNIAMQEEAFAAFDKVIGINDVPKLTSYSIQAELCMKDKSNCTYKNFTTEEIKQLKADPQGFLQVYNAKQAAPKADLQTKEIERLINGAYPNNIHPTALQFINQERTKIKQTKINEV